MNNPQDASTIAFRSDLLDALLALPFDGLVKCAVDLLAHYGYADIQSMGRKDRIGRNQHGGSSGFDIAMTVPGGALRRRAIAQVRQYGQNQPIYQRAVDELRGACVRTGAAEGVLLTLGPVSTAIGKEALPYAPVVPLRVVDGEEFVSRMAHVGLGVRTNDAGERIVDRHYFKKLVGQCAPRTRQHASAPVQQLALLPTPRRGERFVLQVSVAPVFRLRDRQTTRE